MESIRQDLAQFPFVYHAKEHPNAVGARQEDDEEDDDWDSDNDSMILGTTPHVSPPPPLYVTCTGAQIDGSTAV